jgi:hypothetical protein
MIKTMKKMWGDKVKLDQSIQRGADPAGVERQRKPSRRPAHGYAL